MSLLNRLQHAFKAVTPAPVAVMVKKIKAMASTARPEYEAHDWSDEPHHLTRADVEHLRSEGFTVNRWDDCGEPYITIRGWDKPEASGLCADVHALYLKGIKREKRKAMVGAVAVRGQCLLAAKVGKREVLCLLPSYYVQYDYEHTTFSKHLITLLEADGLVVVPHAQQGTATVRGWS